MDWLAASVTATLIGTLLLAGVMGYLYRRDRRSYLGIWALAWAVYAVRLGAMLLMVQGLNHPALSIIHMTAVVGNVILLLWGTRVFLGKTLHPVWIAAAALTALWNIVAVTWDVSLSWLSLPNFLYAGLVFCYTGTAMWRAHRPGLAGYRLTGAAFFVWGLHKFDYPLLRPLAWAAPWGYLLGWWLEMTVAVGMILAHFDRVNSELAAAQKRLDANEERYRRLFNSVNDAMFLYSLGPGGRPGLFLDVNEQACRRLGYRREEMVGRMTVADILDRELVARLDEFYDGLTSRGEVTTATTFRRSDGAGLPHEVNSRIFEMEGRQVVLSSARDISQRLAAERALRESEDNYRTLVDNALDFICLLHEGKVRLPNPACRQVTGYEPEELEGTPVGRLLFPEDRQYLEARYWRRLAGEELPTSTQLRLRKKDGEETWVQVNSVLVNWRGEPATLNITRDINYQKQLEEHMRQSQKLEAVGTLAGGIAHDFNNILSSIIGYTELCLRGEELPDTTREDLQRVLESGFRARDLVRQVLAFSRESEQDLKPIDLRLIVKESLAMLRASLPSSLTMEQRISTVPCMVLADLSQIRQLIVNLCSNASDALAEQGGILRVELNQRDLERDEALPLGLKQGPHVELVVADNGPGMEPEVLERVFEPFFTTKMRDQHSGMGLSVVHGIVKGLAGSVSCNSRPGRGSTFRVTLPALPEVGEAPGRSMVGLPGGQERILVVDDEPGVADYLHRLLEGLGYRVTSLTHGRLAMDLLESGWADIDLVITDHTMPEVGGRQLAARALRLRPDLPVILCSGFAEALAEGEDLPPGVWAYLHKPIGGTTLAEAVRHQLDRAAVLQRH